MFPIVILNEQIIPNFLDKNHISGVAVIPDNFKIILLVKTKVILLNFRYNKTRQIKREVDW
jgi:hypothetical protein